MNNKLEMESTQSSIKLVMCISTIIYSVTGPINRFEKVNGIKRRNQLYNEFNYNCFVLFLCTDFVWLLLTF